MRGFGDSGIRGSFFLSVVPPFRSVETRSFLLSPHPASGVAPGGLRAAKQVRRGGNERGGTDDGLPPGREELFEIRLGISSYVGFDVRHV